MTALHSMAYLVRRAACLFLKHRLDYVHTGGMPYVLCRRCEQEWRGV